MSSPVCTFSIRTNLEPQIGYHSASRCLAYTSSGLKQRSEQSQIICTKCIQEVERRCPPHLAVRGVHSRHVAMPPGRPSQDRALDMRTQADLSLAQEAMSVKQAHAASTSGLKMSVTTLSVLEKRRLCRLVATHLEKACNEHVGGARYACSVPSSNHLTISTPAVA